MDFQHETNYVPLSQRGSRAPEGDETPYPGEVKIISKPLHVIEELLRDGVSADDLEDWNSAPSPIITPGPGVKIKVSPLDERLIRSELRQATESPEAGQDLRAAAHRRLTELKAELTEQRLAMAEIIRNLYLTIRQNPDWTVSHLIQIAYGTARWSELTSHQRLNLRQALDTWATRRSAIKSFASYHTDPGQMFEMCFGQAPQGKVEVIPGPISLHFQCHDPEDYAIIYHFSPDIADRPLSDEEMDEANLSAGVALWNCKVKALEGTVTAENMSNEVKYDTVPQNTTVDLLKARFELEFDHQTGDLVITTSGGGHWLVTFLQRDNSGLPTRVQIIDVAGGQAPLADLSFIYKGPNLAGLADFGQDETSPKGKRTFDLVEPGAGNSQPVVELSLDYYGLTIRGLTEKMITVQYRDNTIVKLPDEEKSLATQIHEEQHQFNKLFQPMERRMTMFRVMDLAAASGATPAEVAELISHDLAHWARQDMADNHARDEMIAYLNNEHSTAEIYDILTKSELYDYYTKFKDSIDTLPDKFSESIAMNLTEVSFSKLKDKPSQGEPDEAGRQVTNLKRFHVDSKLIAAAIEEVFTNEYRRDLKSWLNAVALMQDKGYTKEEILSVLVQEPLRTWRSIARRLADRRQSQVEVEPQATDKTAAVEDAQPMLFE